MLVTPVTVAPGTEGAVAASQVGAGSACAGLANPTSATSGRVASTRAFIVPPRKLTPVGQTVLDRVSDGARVEPREAGLALVRKVRVRRGDRARLVQPGDLVGGQLPADRAEVLPQLLLVA